MSNDPAPPRHPNERRFEEFFVADTYIALKNYLYNYLERKRAINRVLSNEDLDLILEVGSGLSPIVTDRPNIIYSELSFRALQTLRRLNGTGKYVVADGTQLPFRTGALSHVICSEVLEHIEQDQKAIDELARVLRPDGLACITVPHRKFYMAADDRFVRHFRRYEIDEMREKLDHAGFRLRATKKVLGPLEKITMFSVVMVFLTAKGLLRKGQDTPGEEKRSTSIMHTILHTAFEWSHKIYAVIARIDAAIMPRSLATVILFEAVKDKGTEAK